MNDIRAKVVGLGYHKVNNPVKSGDVVYIQADYDNEIDANAISVMAKAEAKGVYHKNTVSRKVSRMTLAVNKLA